MRCLVLVFLIGLCTLGAQADDPDMFGLMDLGIFNVFNVFKDSKDPNDPKDPKCGEETKDIQDLKREWGVDFITLTASADIRSAYLSRAKVCEARPMSSQLLSGDIHLYPIHVPGRVGIDFWTISSLTHKMDTIHEDRFFQERDFTLRYGYDWDIAEGWRLASDVMSTWVNLPGYRHDLGLDYCRHEWRLAQRLDNPWVTPYYLIRRSVHPDDWLYVRIGAQHAFHLTDTISLTPNFYAECGNDRHFRQRYGVNDPPWASYNNGVQALNAVLTLSWKVTKWASLFASVQQFDIVDDDARDRTKAKKTHNSRRDLTVGTVGVVCRF